MDRFGTLIWNQSFGGSDVDNVRYLKQTSDGGYLMSGSSKSYGSGGSDIWLIKAYPSGLIEWNKNYGTANNEYGGKSIENYKYLDLQVFTLKHFDIIIEV